MLNIISRDHRIQRRRDASPVPVREGLVMVGGFMAFNLLAVAGYVYLRLLVQITPVNSPWGWSIVSVLCITVLPISSVALFMQLGDYSRRARGVGMVSVSLGLMIFSVLWASIIFIDLWQPNHTMIVGWHMGNVCEAICPADLLLDYQQHVRHSMQQLQESLTPPAPMNGPDHSI